MVQISDILQVPGWFRDMFVAFGPDLDAKFGRLQRSARLWSSDCGSSTWWFGAESVVSLQVGSPICLQESLQIQAQFESKARSGHLNGAADVA